MANIPVLVPGNYGTANIIVRGYDVIDTLDAILPGQKFFEQPIMRRFKAPEPMIPYMQRRVTLPPRVRDHPYFDNEFSRILFLMIDEGKSVAEIAEIADCDTTFVHEQIRLLYRERYARQDTAGVKLLIPVIHADEAEAARQKALDLADTVTTLIAARMDAYRRVLDSLVAAGTVTADTNTFFDPGAVLHKPYHVVSALVLWRELGRLFITRSAPLLIYDGTDLCNASIPTYMYVVEGGPVVNGTHFYAALPQGESMRILFGDSIPELVCSPDFILYRQRPRLISFHYEDEYAPESAVMDTNVVRPVLDAMTQGADSLLYNAYIDLRDMAVDRFGHERLDYGYRYWFWNLTATHVLNRLYEQGVVDRRGNGQIQISTMEF